MGHLITGFAFAAQPDWARLAKLFPAFPSRGYKHKRASLFMWDVWKPDPQARREHFPFSAGPIVPRDVEAPNTLPSSGVTDMFDRACGLLKTGGHSIYPADWLAVPLLVASAAGVATFAFTADDEEMDFAALVDSGKFRQAGCRHGYYEVDIQADSVSVRPLVSDEDEIEVDGKVLASLAATPGITVLDSREVEGGFAHHDYPLRLWPKGWGDAEKLLGLGTWDGFLNIKEDFDPVFQSEPMVKPWWRIWR